MGREQWEELEQFQEHNNGKFCGMETNVKKRDTVNKGLIDEYCGSFYLVLELQVAQSSCI